MKTVKNWGWGYGIGFTEFESWKPGHITCIIIYIYIYIYTHRIFFGMAKMATTCISNPQKDRTGMKRWSLSPYFIVGFLFSIRKRMHMHPMILVNCWIQEKQSRFLKPRWGHSWRMACSGQSLKSNFIHWKHRTAATIQYSGCNFWLFESFQSWKASPRADVVQ